MERSSGKSSRIKMPKSERLRRDRIDIARRYEKMRLFKEAIIYFRKAGEEAEAVRVENDMRSSYSRNAAEMESRGEYRKAYELYKIIEDTENVRRLEQQHGFGQEKMNPPAQPGGPMTGPQLWSRPNADGDSIDLLESDVPTEKTPQMRRGSRVPVDASDRPSMNKVPVQKDEPFRVCPYCGKALNLPKRPRFCPFCEEPFQ